MKSTLYKTYYVFLVFYFSIFSPFSQEPNTDYVGVYKWKIPVFMQKADASGTLKKGEFELSKSNQYFTIIRVLQRDSVLIKIGDYAPNNTFIKKDYIYKTFTESKTLIDTSYQTITGDTTVTIRHEIITSKGKLSKFKKKESDTKPNPSFYKYNFNGEEEEFSDNPNSYYLDQNCQTYFIVSKEMIDNYTYYREKSSLAFGVINFPFKVRIQKEYGDFTGSFNFGTAVGLRCSKQSFRDWSLSFILGSSISSIRLDTTSVLRNKYLLQGNNDFTAFSISIGPMIEYKNVQIGLFLGWDHLARINQSTFDWDYQGKPWLSIGLGYSIFSSSSNRKTNLQNINQE